MVRCHDDPANPSLAPPRAQQLQELPAMPGKSQQGGRGKQDSSKERVNSASQRYSPGESTGLFDDPSDVAVRL